MSREDVHSLGVAYTGCLACAVSAQYSLVHARVFGLTARLMTRCGGTGGFARNKEIEGGIDDEVEAHILGILTHGISYSYSSCSRSVFFPRFLFSGGANVPLSCKGNKGVNPLFEPPYGGTCGWSLGNPWGSSLLSAVTHEIDIAYGVLRRLECRYLEPETRRDLVRVRWVDRSCPGQWKESTAGWRNALPSPFSMNLDGITVRRFS